MVGFAWAYTLEFALTKNSNLTLRTFGQGCVEHNANLIAMRMPEL
jgi:hypothetical protein